MQFSLLFQKKVLSLTRKITKKKINNAKKDRRDVSGRV
jgi:hypothetical protein